MTDEEAEIEGKVIMAEIRRERLYQDLIAWRLSHDLTGSALDEVLNHHLGMIRHQPAVDEVEPVDRCRDCGVSWRSIGDPRVYVPEPMREDLAIRREHLICEMADFKTDLRICPNCVCRRLGQTGARYAATFARWSRGRKVTIQAGRPAVTAKED